MQSWGVRKHNLTWPFEGTGGRADFHGPIFATTWPDASINASIFSFIESFGCSQTTPAPE
jgi:hypothetical protein